MRLLLICLLAAGAYAADRGNHGGGVRQNGGSHMRSSIQTLDWNRHGRYGNGYGGFYWAGLPPAGDSGFAPPAQPSGLIMPMVYPAISEPTPQPAVHPVIHEYGPPESFALAPASPEQAPVLYLIAFRDTTIHAAMTYWVEGATLHYLDHDHQQKQAPLASVDRELSAQLNRERNVPFNLP